ncbi:MAG TPA: ankyrin repeat domain-containing protein [Permianibacter sp.]|nr:ankyrin repeat domain-containing protein [Permianibacter sp.]
MTRSPMPLSRQTALPFAGVWFITLFAAGWNGVVTFVLLPVASFQTSGFKWFFLGSGVLVTTLAISGWRQRFRGGAMHFSLSQPEVPVGVPVMARFETDKSLQADDWQATLTLEAPGRHRRSRRILLRQPLAVTALSDRLLETSLRIPPRLQQQVREVPPRFLHSSLMIKSKIASWEFRVPVRLATEQERQAAGTSPEVDSPRHVREREAAKARRSRFVALVLGAMALGTVLMFWNLFSPLRNLVGEVYDTSVGTPPFALDISNWNSNHWGVQARLKGQAQFRDGMLEVQVESLALRKMNACMAAEKHAYCRVTLISAVLILTEDRGNHFATVARSNAIALDAVLEGYDEWQLETDQEWVLNLSIPDNTLSTGQILKLELQTDDGGTYYPDAERLALHRTLASALGKPDPCDDIADRREAFDAGCAERLQALLQQPLPRWQQLTAGLSNLLASLQLIETSRDSLDHLLIDAIKTERNAMIEPLLRAGANPDAVEPDNPYKTAVGLAAEFGLVDVLELLVRHGGRTDISIASENDVNWTPLKLAARRNSIASIDWLLNHGTSLHDTDANNWTALHAAARASAVEAIERLVEAGANIDSKTHAWRHETPLMTALRNGSEEAIEALVNLGADTDIRDIQGKNACEWARYYHRGDDVEAMVCAD